MRGRPRGLALAVLALFILAGCASVQRDLRYEAASGETGAQLADIERSLVFARVRGEPDPAFLELTMRRIDASLSLARSDQRAMARLGALAADAALLAGDRRKAAEYLARSRVAYGGDELAFLAEARLEADPARRAALLEAAMLAADGNLVLRAEYGAALLALGRHSEALASLDEALPRLPEEYAALYQPSRDRAYALREAAAPEGEPAPATLGDAPLSLGAMVELAQGETSALDWFTGGTSWAIGPLFERLKAGLWFADPVAPRSRQATRADAALFLWRLMCRDDRDRLTRYTAKYSSRGASPVPDVALGSPFFDAALGVVEAGVMQLPDGRNFRPSDGLSGIEFYGMLMEAAVYR